jgi:hypothetical protein
MNPKSKKFENIVRCSPFLDVPLDGKRQEKRDHNKAIVWVRISNSYVFSPCRKPNRRHSPNHDVKSLTVMTRPVGKEVGERIVTIDGGTDLDGVANFCLAKM